MSLEAYHERDLACHENLELNGFNSNALHGPFGIVSSVGDLSRLGILNAYLPSAKGDRKLTITDLLLGIRIRIPSFTVIAYQFNGELCCNFCIASEYTTPEAFGFMTDAFVEWAMGII